MNIIRGSVWYADPPSEAVGSEQDKARPCIIVSNDKANEFSPVIEAVFCTRQKKKYLPTHMKVVIRGEEQTILAEQIHSISKQRLQKQIGMLYDNQIETLNHKLAVSLGLIPESDW